jgi:hypothetical protein
MVYPNNHVKEGAICLGMFSYVHFKLRRSNSIFKPKSIREDRKLEAGIFHARFFISPHLSLPAIITPNGLPF